MVLLLDFGIQMPNFEVMTQIPGFKWGDQIMVYRPIKNSTGQAVCLIFFSSQ